MTGFGHVIKFERIRQNIKQVQLAKDICTPAYLSKIENNLIVPTEELSGQLLKRLNVHQPLPPGIEEENFKHVQQVYFEAIRKKDRKQIEIHLSKILNDQFIFSDRESFFTHHLMVLRLTMLTNDVKYDISTFLKTVSSFSKDFNTYQLFIFYSCLAYFHYYNSEHVSSLHAIEKALHFHDKCAVKEYETADFYYGLGTLYLQNQKLLAAIEYNDNALSYFNKEFLFLRAIESNIIKAVIYKRSGNLNQALESLLIAEKISLHHDSQENLSMIYLNIASILSEKQNIKPAIEYYRKSIEIGSDLKSKLISIYCLVLENSINGDCEEVLKWSKYGIELYKENPLDDLKSMYFHFCCHISKHSGYENFESIVSDSIHHFVTVQDNRHAHKYALLLANYFHTERKYKKASYYFSMANNYLAKKEERKFVEDI